MVFILSNNSSLRTPHKINDILNLWSRMDAIFNLFDGFLHSEIAIVNQAITDVNQLFADVISNK